ncbi:MAG: sortase B protein-sorting domain-containing protein [Nitrospina sp.]|nr:sortase B protein-sorting domain-containing protein [Nitrospina sp.]
MENNASQKTSDHSGLFLYVFLFVPSFFFQRV